MQWSDVIKPPSAEDAPAVCRALARRSSAALPRWRCVARPRRHLDVGAGRRSAVVVGVRRSRRSAADPADLHRLDDRGVPDRLDGLARRAGASLFYVVFTPVALVFRLMGRDALRLRRPDGRRPTGRRSRRRTSARRVLPSVLRAGGMHGETSKTQRKAQRQTGMVAEFWYFLKTQQEVVAAADRRDPAGVRRAGVPVGHGCGAVHLHAVLSHGTATADDPDPGAAQARLCGRAHGVLLLLVCEGGLRVRAVDAVRQPGRGRARSDARRTIRRRTSRCRRPGYEVKGAHIHIKINSLGFRGDEFSREKPAGTVRIAVPRRVDDVLRGGVVERHDVAAPAAGEAARGLSRRAASRSSTPRSAATSRPTICKNLRIACCRSIPIS